MELGLIGLGKMGGNMRERIRRAGHTVIGYDRNPDVADVHSIDELVNKLKGPRVVWVMVPAGVPTQITIDELAELLSPGDIVVDGGNSRWTDDEKHAEQLNAKGIGFVDCGVSGGVWGLENGYALMYGGARACGRAQQKKQARRGGLRSGARADGRDPLPLGAAINRLITERGWEAPAAVGGVMGRWPQMVGPEVAQHCEPQRYDEDARVLTVRCDSTAWATQLRLLAPQLVARLNADLGHGTVKMIKVLGPGGPAHRYGPLRSPGSTGPGDTYG
ncbi:hypothetical protein SANTM175S_06568 [Streptomyces antimycoticus]